MRVGGQPPELAGGEAPQLAPTLANTNLKPSRPSSAAAATSRAHATTTRPHALRPPPDAISFAKQQAPTASAQ